MDIDLAQVETSKVISQIKEKLIEINSKPFRFSKYFVTSFPSSPLAIDKQTVKDSAEGLLGLQIRLAIEFANLIKNDDIGSIMNISSIMGNYHLKWKMYETEKKK